jgi:RNA polymerase sigma-70 factor (ECF subfamily)
MTNRAPNSDNSSELMQTSATAREAQTDRWSQLLVRAKEGDSAALVLLLGEMLPWLFLLARAALGNEADAADIAQEVALRVWRGLATFHPHRGSARAWAGRILRNEVANQRRRGSRRSERLDSHDLTSDRDDPVAEAERKENQAAVALALNHLRPEVQNAVRHRYEAELSYQELAEALQVPIGTVATRVHRGVKVLRHRLRGTAY